MERSAYLDLFDRETITAAYESGKEADGEEIRMLYALLTLTEKRESRAVSPEFAARDWSLVRLHLKSRERISEPSGICSSVTAAAKKLSLNAPERMALVLAFAAEQDAVFLEALARLRGGRDRGRASLQAAAYLYKARLALEADGTDTDREEADFMLRPERAALFLESGWRPEESAREAPLRLLRPVSEFLRGRPVTAGGAPFVREREESGPLPRILLYEELFLRLCRMCARETGDWNLRLCGGEGSGKEFLARHLAAAQGRRLFVVDGAAGQEEEAKERPLGLTPGDREQAMELICALLLTGGLLYWKSPSGALPALVRRYLPGLLLFGSDGGTEDPPVLSGRAVSVELPCPAAGQKALLWAEFLKDYAHARDLEPAFLGSRYVLNAGGIRRALYAARKWADGGGRDAITQEDLAWAVEQAQSGQLGRYAARIPCVFSWEDLIVEEGVKKRLHYICGQAKYRSTVGSDWGFFEKMPYGKGLCALFYGPPGTGKTMAVQVIARELGLDLYRVDLSQMVSKYIGETEKNISGLFEKAAHMNVILFFDEADAFFSRRSEVKDAHDKNANNEVAHLLQKLEEYEGITVLATNLKDYIDDAFIRRITFMVHFRLPSAPTRRLLWRSMLPEKAPRESGLDLDFFAERFELSGSQIKEILLHAAYMAAGQGKAIGNREIKEALCLNFEKYGKILTEHDFGYLADSCRQEGGAARG